MLDFTTESRMLRLFSDYTLNQAYGAVTIRDKEGNDLAIIHKNNEAYAQYHPRIRKIIPTPNHYKFHDVVKAIQDKIKEN